MTVDRSYEEVVANIKFTAVVEKRSCQVVLEDVSNALPVLVSGFWKMGTNSSKSRQFNGPAPICVLSWFHNPHFVGLNLILFHELRILRIISRFDMISFWEIGKGVQFSDILMVVQK